MSAATTAREGDPFAAYALAVYDLARAGLAPPAGTVRAWTREQIDACRRHRAWQRTQVLVVGAWLEKTGAVTSCA